MRSFTAMTSSALLLILIGLVALAAVVGTIVTVVRDGYRPVRTDRNRIPARSTGRDAAAPAAPSPAAPAPAPAESGTPTSALRVQRGWL
jgi:hypothetical protein